MAQQDRHVRFVLQVHITSACDMRCAHCYQRDAKPQNMALSDFKTLMAQLSELAEALKTERGADPLVLVTLTGGEPLLHPRFKQIVYEVWRWGFDLAVLTNGHFVDTSTAVLLRNAKFVQVSLDGDKPTHNSIRGEGDFERVLDGIRALKAARANPIVSFTAHADNYRTLPAAVTAAKKAGANRFWSDRYLPLGESPAFDALNAEQTAEYLQLLARSSKKRGGIVMRHRALQFICGGIPYACHAGTDILAVDENCQVYPCRRLPLPCGDFRETPLASIYADNPTVAALRAFDQPEECAACEHAAQCAGGLRCLSAAVAGDWHVADPGCPKINRTQNDVDSKEETDESPDQAATRTSSEAGAPDIAGASARKLKHIKQRPPRLRGAARAFRSLKRTFGGRHD